MPITDSEEFLVEKLLDFRESNKEPVASNTNKHKLEEIGDFDERNRKIRKRCVACYTKNRQQLGNREADKATITPRVTTYYSRCPEKPAMCAFVQYHEG